MADLVDPSDPPVGTSVWQLLQARARVTPERTMLVAPTGAKVSFRSALERAEVLAGVLSREGFAAGDVVAWQLPTRLSTVFMSLALSRLGVVQSPLITQYRHREVRFTVAQTAAAHLIVPGRWHGVDYPEQAAEAIAGLPNAPRIWCVDRLLALAEANVIADRGRADWPVRVADAKAPSPAEVSWVFYTSGTTADPKGVRHSDDSVVAGGVAFSRRVGLQSDDIAGVAFPWAHAGGSMYLVAALTTGCAVMLLEEFDPPEAVAAYRRGGVTVTGGSTAFYQALLGQQRQQPAVAILPSLRLLTGGAAPMPAEVYFAVRDELGVPLCHGYGSTESMICMGAPTDTDEQLARTVGLPVDGMRVRVRRDGGRLGSAGEEGEIEVSGTSLFSGYLDESLNAEAFTHDGWYRTADLGSVGADGRVRITGRRKDIIIRKGENISAKEVEDLLCTHALIADAAVIGLPDADRGEMACAVVEPAEAAMPITFDEMVEHLASCGLMRQKIPERLEVMAALPRGATYGKVLKAELRARFSRKV